MDEVKARRARWKNIWILLLLVFGGLYFLYPLAMNVMLWHLAREMSKEYPSVALIPRQLQSSEVADIKNGVTIQRFGYSFQFPSTKVSKQDDFKEIAAVHFEGGLIVLIMDPAKEMDLLSVKGDERGSSAMKQMFTPHELESHYNYAVAMMNAEPSDVSLFHSRIMNVRAMTLLSMKSMEVSRKPSAIFKIESARIKGFQMGDPQVVPTDITLKLYDAQDRQIEIHLAGKKGSTVPMITQPQINALVSSIQTTN